MRVSFGAAVIGLWAAWVVTQRALSGRFWPVLLPDLLPPIAYVLVPLLLAPLLLRIGRRRWLAALVLLATLVVQLPRAGLNGHAVLPGPRSPEAGRISVFSWNTEYWHQSDDVAGFYAFLRAQRADIYLLQEYELASAAAVTGVSDPGDLAALRASFPGYSLVQRGELVTLSRFPIVATPGVAPDPGPASTDNWDFLAIVTKTLRVDVRTPAGILSTYNVHLPVQLSQANPLTPEFYRNVRDADRRRVTALRGLASSIRTNPHPSVIAGDFNTTAAMGDLRGVRSVARDAEHADVYPISWNLNTPLRFWRLDWLFVAGGVAAWDYRFGDPGGFSDHRPQHVNLTLR